MSRVSAPSRFSTLALAFLLQIGGRAETADCNGNGIPDDRDLAPSYRFGDTESFVLDGADPRAVAGGDFDADGDSDIAVLDVARRLLLVFWNDGRGEFPSPPLELLPGERLAALLAGDVDGDGIVDLVVVKDDFPGRLAIFRSLGGRRFAAARDVVTVERQAVAAALGDVDGDGLRDFVVTHTALPDANAVTVLYQGLAGSFEEVDILTVGERPLAVVLADFDGDGLLDIAAANNATNDVSVLLTRGRGDFVGLSSIPVDESPRDIVAADFDLDDDVDLAAVSSDGESVTFLWNDGDADFSRVSAVSLPGGPSALGVVPSQEEGVAPALAVAREDDRAVSILEFTTPDTIEVIRDVSVGTLPTDLVVLDLDGSGSPALVTANRSFCCVGGSPAGQGFAVARVERGVDPLRRAVRFAIGSEPRAVEAFDLGGDGLLDFAATRSVEVVVFENQGGRSFQEKERLPVAGTMGDLGVADLDGDGREDLIAAASVFVVFWNEGDGLLEPAPTTFPSGGILELVDVDEDGRLDLVGASVVLNRGERRFEEIARLETSWPLIGLDLENDGDVDLVSSLFEIFEQVEPFVFEERRLDLFVNRSGGIATADVDLDGMSDLVATHFQALRVLRGAGGGEFLLPSEFPFPGVLGRLRLLDVDDDTDLDVVLANTATNTVSVLLNDGVGGYFGLREFAVGAAPVYLDLADLDADGILDVLVSGEDSGDVTLLYGEVLPPRSVDEDGDGRPDDCRTSFHRGDADGDAILNLTDAISIFGFLFLGDEAPTCLEAADTQNDGVVNITDGIGLLAFLFLGGAPPASPGPTGRPCGHDTDLAGTVGDLGCELYDGCSR